MLMHATERSEAAASDDLRAETRPVAPASRFAARCLERFALQLRLAERMASPPGHRDERVPTVALDTATVMAAVAPLFMADGAGAFGRSSQPTPGASVRRMLTPLPGDRLLAVDVVPQALRFAPADLARVLQELVDNGWRHSPPGSTVRLRGAPGVGGYQLSVTNPGPKLPRSVVAALRPGRHGTAIAEAGLQLGLPLAAALAELNGARVEVLRGAGRPNTLRVIVRTD
jgi:signal transduction histidine kinase